MTKWLSKLFVYTSISWHLYLSLWSHTTRSVMLMSSEGISNVWHMNIRRVWHIVCGKVDNLTIKSTKEDNIDKQVNHCVNTTPCCTHITRALSQKNQQDESNTMFSLELIFFFLYLDQCYLLGSNYYGIFVTHDVWFLHTGMDQSISHHLQYMQLLELVSLAV